jgi:hypothetical protein
VLLLKHEASARNRLRPRRDYEKPIPLLKKLNSDSEIKGKQSFFLGKIWRELLPALLD